MAEKIFDLEERLVEFSCRIIEVVETLPNSKAGNYITAQLIRCGLAPALWRSTKRRVETGFYSQDENRFKRA